VGVCRDESIERHRRNHHHWNISSSVSFLSAFGDTTNPNSHTKRYATSVLQGRARNEHSKIVTPSPMYGYLATPWYCSIANTRLKRNTCLHGLPLLLQISFIMKTWVAAANNWVESLISLPVVLFLYIANVIIRLLLVVLLILQIRKSIYSLDERISVQNVIWIAWLNLVPNQCKITNRSMFGDASSFTPAVWYLRNTG
jgi:hypothetical protein